jgi:predicted dehydrogenase
MRFLVVGTGSIGQRHCRNLVALGQEVLAWDLDERRRALTAEIAGVAVMPTQHDAFAARPDAVVVCTPPAHHVAVARRAIDAGAHAFVEKPIAHESGAVPALIAEAARCGVRLAVGFNLRLVPSLARVRALLDAKRIGRVLSVRAEFGAYLPDWRPGRDYRDGYAVSAALGGGILLDAIHELDYLGWLFGDAEEIVAAAEHVSDLAGDTEDLAEITIRFASGVLAQVHLDYVQRAYRRTLHVIGTDGVVAWDYPAHTVTVHEADGGPHVEDHRATDGEPNDMYVEEMRHFIRCVEGSEPPLVDGREGLRSLRLVEAAKQSSRERRWVKLR